MSDKLKKLYLVTVCNDEVGEAQGMYDADKNLLHMWSLNDASYRSEYLDPLLEALGYEVVSGTKQLEKRFVADAKEWWGL